METVFENRTKMVLLNPSNPDDPPTLETSTKPAQLIGEPVIAALNLTPFAFHHLPASEALAALEDGRVVAVNDVAASRGLELGMGESAARLKVRGAILVPSRSSDLSERWRALVAELAGFTPDLEPLREGLIVMRVKRGEAREISAVYGGRVGLAETRELALVASAVARGGDVVTVDDRTTFLNTVPFEALSVLGLETDAISRLRWLGLRAVGDLLAWSKKQVMAYFGFHHKTVLELLYGGSSLVARYRAPLELMASHEFDELVQEPRDVEPIVTLLAERLFPRLRGRSPGRVVITAATSAGSRRETLATKHALSSARMLERAILRALEASHACLLGFDHLEVRLTELNPTGYSVGLFTRPGAELAHAKVQHRYPGSLKRWRETEPFTQARDRRYSLHDWTEDTRAPRDAKR